MFSHIPRRFFMNIRKYIDHFPASLPKPHKKSCKFEICSFFAEREVLETVFYIMLPDCNRFVFLVLRNLYIVFNGNKKRYKKPILVPDFFIEDFFY